MNAGDKFTWLILLRAKSFPRQPWYHGFVWRSISSVASNFQELLMNCKAVQTSVRICDVFVC